MKFKKGIFDKNNITDLFSELDNIRNSSPQEDWVTGSPYTQPLRDWISTYTGARFPLYQMNMLLKNYTPEGIQQYMDSLKDPKTKSFYDSSVRSVFDDAVNKMNAVRERKGDLINGPDYATVYFGTHSNGDIEYTQPLSLDTFENRSMQLHENAHAFDNSLNKDFLQWFIDNKFKKDYMENLTNSGYGNRVDYYKRPRELYARIKELQWATGKKPEEKFTEDDINTLERKNPYVMHELRNVFDDDIILLLMNVIAKNNNKDESLNPVNYA